MELEKTDKDYQHWLEQVKSRIRTARIKASLAANAELISFYWDLGKMIIEKQSQTSWGDKLIEQVANDLKVDFPDMTGLSTSNLKYCKRFYQFYHSQIGQQPVDQLQTMFSRSDYRLTEYVFLVRR
jgi:predicted nuclease of restriction endonuclease-like (RecB) superfamily